MALTSTESGALQPQDYHPKSGRVVAGMPIALETHTALQHVVNQVASEALVARQVLDVEYVDEVVPIGLLEIGCPTPATADVSLYTPTPPPVGKLLKTIVDLDAAALQAVEECPRSAGLPQLVRATRKLALAETESVFLGVADQGTVAEASDGPIAERLLTAATALRTQGFGGDLVLAIDGQTWADLSRIEEPVRKRLKAQIGTNTVFLPASAGRLAVLMAPGGESVRLVIGDNYALRWLSSDGVHHKFSLTVGLRVVVIDGDAVQVIK
jgi:uncharacterized linocin/CFP29 family protein